MDCSLPGDGAAFLATPLVGVYEYNSIITFSQMCNVSFKPSFSISSKDTN